MKGKHTTPENFIQPLRQVTLSKTDSQNLRERLISYADLHTAPTTISSAVGSSRFSLRTLSQFQFVQSSRSFVAAILIIAFLGGSASISYAAENTLPGEPLYAVKVNVNEPLHAALITSPTQKAEWENELVERRLAEGAALAAQNKLATSTQTYLAQNIAEHVANSEKSADALAASGNGAQALAVRSDLEARLSAQVDVLALMTPRLQAQGDATTTTAVLALAQNVDEARATVTTSRKKTETELSDMADATDQSADVPTDTASSTVARATPTKDAVSALVENQAKGRQEKEIQLLNKAATKLGLTLPPAAATSTATTSANIEVSPRGETSMPLDNATTSER
jgi:hypothetical protein